MYIVQSGIQTESKYYDMRGMIASIDTVTQVSIKFRKKKKVNKNMGTSVEHNTNNTCEHGVKCVRIWTRREMHIHFQIHIHRN